MIPTASNEAERDFRERGLTEREADAARSALAGMTAAAAAREMGIGSSTVGSLRQRAYRKLGVSGTTELVRKYAEKSVDKDAGEKDWRPTLHSHGLSETQASVLSLACSGRSTTQIAGELHLAEGTVRAARAAGYRMLGVHSREELSALLEREAAAPRRRRAARLAAARRGGDRVRRGAQRRGHGPATGVGDARRGGLSSHRSSGIGKWNCGNGRQPIRPWAAYKECLRSSRSQRRPAP